MNTLKHKIRKEAGFTLIELMVAMFCFGILLIITVPTFSGVIAKAQDMAGPEQVAKAQEEKISDFNDRVDAAEEAAAEDAIAEADANSYGNEQTYTPRIIGVIPCPLEEGAVSEESAPNGAGRPE